MKTLLKLAAVAGLAYGAYYVYKNYIKQPETGKREFSDVQSTDFEYNSAARDEDSFAARIKAAAQKQLDRL